MYFIKLFGCPEENVNRAVRRLVTRGIMKCVGESAKIRAFFIKDQVGDPDEGQDSTILVELDPDMFSNWLGEENMKAAKERTARVVAEILQMVYEGKFGVKITISGVTVLEVPPNPKQG